MFAYNVGHKTKKLLKHMLNCQIGNNSSAKSNKTARENEFWPNWLADRYLRQQMAGYIADSENVQKARTICLRHNDSAPRLSQKEL